MVLLDVNILVYSFRGDSPDHELYRGWLERAMEVSTIGLSELVLSGFVRVVTHPRVFRPATPVEEALEFVEALQAHPASLRLRPGERHWRIFADLCRATGVRGNDIPDAYHAALAVEHGLEWITTDRGFARFPGLRWRHPLVS